MKNNLFLTKTYYASLALLLFSNNALAAQYTIPDSIFSDNGWAKPLDGTLSSNTDFNYNSATYKANFGINHGGTDLISILNNPVYAIDDGEVLRVAQLPNSTFFGINGDLSHIFAKHTDINGKDFLVIYGHVSAIDGLKVGDKITQGQKIGVVKKFNYPDHVHFGISSDVQDYLVPVWGSIYGSITDPIEFLKNTKNKAAPITYRPLFNGSGSLVDASSECLGCNRDVAVLQASSKNLSMAAFQWIYNAQTCSHINLKATEAVNLSIQTKAWSAQNFKSAFTVSLAANQVVSIAKADDMIPWSLISIVSQQALANNASLEASCQVQGASFQEANRQSATPQAIVLADGSQWAGTGSIISAIAQNAHGFNKDVAISSSSKSTSNFQWQATSTCSSLQLVDYRKPSSTRAAQVSVKLWNASNTSYAAKCTSLPCTLKADAMGFYTVAIQTEAGVIEGKNILATCTN